MYGRPYRNVKTPELINLAEITWKLFIYDRLWENYDDAAIRHDERISNICLAV